MKAWEALLSGVSPQMFLFTWLWWIHWAFVKWKSIFYVLSFLQDRILPWATEETGRTLALTELSQVLELKGFMDVTLEEPRINLYQCLLHHWRCLQGVGELGQQQGPSPACGDFCLGGVLWSVFWNSYSCGSNCSRNWEQVISLCPLSEDQEYKVHGWKW